MQHLLLVTLFTVAMTKLPKQNEACPKLMMDAGLNKYFGNAVAHRMHSLTLEDLRYYFKSDAPKDNGIPTVNYDLTPNATRVLPNAPLCGYDMSFKTIAMKHTDKVLSKMSHKHWGIKHYSILEKLVHAHHMSELWKGAKNHYDNFVKIPPTDKVCRCVRDIKQNDVLAELELLALKIKFPGLTSGNPDLPHGKNGHRSPGQKRWGYKLSYGISFSSTRAGDKSGKFSIDREEFMIKLRNFDFKRDEQEVVEDAMKELQDGDQGLSDHLTDEQGWKAWREGFKGMDENDNFQFGMFMYCMLNK